MFAYEPENNTKILVEGKKYEGLGLKKQEVIKHVEDLRALGYSILNTLVMGNAKTAFVLVKSAFPNLPKILMKDVLILPGIIESQHEN